MRGPVKLVKIVSSPPEKIFDSSIILVGITTLSFLFRTVSANVNGTIICSNPSSLLSITTLCLFPSTRSIPLIRNLAQLQRVEVEPVRSGNHDLAVEHAALL